MITKDQFQIIREYFLSFNQGIRSNIRHTAGVTLLKYITIIETGFFNDVNIDQIVSQIDSAELSEDLSKLKQDYYLQLASRELEGEECEQIDQMHETRNLSYMKILDDLSVDKSFVHDVASAITLSERTSLKKFFHEIDEEEGAGISDEEIQEAIKSVERKAMRKQFTEIDRADSNGKAIRLFIQFAIAASFIGFIVAILIPIFNKNEEQNFVQNAAVQANLDSIFSRRVDMKENVQKEKSYKILKDQTSFNLAGRNNMSDSIAVQINIINNQIDSSGNITETYTYMEEAKWLILNLSEGKSIKSLIHYINGDRLDLYVNLNNSYFLILNTETPRLLQASTDKQLIEELKRIEFINE